MGGSGRAGRGQTCSLLLPTWETLAPGTITLKLQRYYLNVPKVSLHLMNDERSVLHTCRYLGIGVHLGLPNCLRGTAHSTIMDIVFLREGWLASQWGWGGWKFGSLAERHAKSLSTLPLLSHRLTVSFSALNRHHDRASEQHCTLTFKHLAGLARVRAD